AVQRLRSAAVGLAVALVARLAQQPDDRSARDRPALAAARMVAAEKVWPGSSLARRSAAHCARDPRADHPDGAREFPLGRTAHPWRAAETRLRRIAGHGVTVLAGTGRQIANLAHLPAQSSAWHRSGKAIRSAGGSRPPRAPASVSGRVPRPLCRPIAGGSR